jgi:hypothetical protein
VKQLSELTKGINATKIKFQNHSKLEEIKRTLGNDITWNDFCNWLAEECSEILLKMAKERNQK